MRALVVLVALLAPGCASMRSAWPTDPVGCAGAMFTSAQRAVADAVAVDLACRGPVAPPASSPDGGVR